MKKLLIILTILSSCVDPGFEGCDFKTFTIKKGTHRDYAANIGIQNSGDISNPFNFEAIFVSGAIYSFNDQDSLDINKLLGFIECNINPRTNSARFGWRSKGDSIEIVTYVYNNGIRVPDSEQILGYTYEGVVDNYCISYTDTTYIFNFNGVEKTETRTPQCLVPDILSGPYFGGNRTSPHKVKIQIKYNCKLSE